MVPERERHDHVREDRAGPPAAHPPAPLPHLDPALLGTAARLFQAYRQRDDDKTALLAWAAICINGWNRMHALSHTPVEGA